MIDLIHLSTPLRFFGGFKNRLCLADDFIYQMMLVVPFIRIVMGHRMLTFTCGVAIGLLACVSFCSKQRVSCTGVNGFSTKLQ